MYFGRAPARERGKKRREMSVGESTGGSPSCEEVDPLLPFSLMVLDPRLLEIGEERRLTESSNIGVARVEQEHVDRDLRFRAIDGEKLVERN